MVSILPNIVLIGFMGSGKTAVSSLLGSALRREIFEMDKEIALRAGYSTVAQLIDDLGEPYFRDLESYLAKEIASQRGLVVPTGGGIITREGNMAAFVEGGAKVVFLDCAFETLRLRLSPDNNPAKDRPLFRDLESAKQLFISRHPIYKKWGSIRIPADTLTPVQVTERIVELLGKEVEEVER